MKKERRIIMRNPQDISLYAWLQKLENLKRLKLEERYSEGRKLERDLEGVLRAKGPSTEIEAILDDVRFIVHMAADGKAFLTRSA